MSSMDSNIKMMRKALDRSYLFIRGLCRYSFRDSIEHPSKKQHRKFKFRKVAKIEHESNIADKVRYWAILILIPFIILVISFSFISEPGKFFSKSGGINVSDMKKFIVLPGVSITLFLGYMMYSYWKSPKRYYLRKKTKIKHIKIKDQNKPPSLHSDSGEVDDI